MPMQWQTIPVDFRGGVDTKSDAKDVLPTKLLKLENGNMDKFGKISKRKGYSRISNDMRYEGSGAFNVSIEETGGRAIHADGDNLYLFTKDDVFKATPADGFVYHENNIDLHSLSVRDFNVYDADVSRTHALNMDIAANDTHILMGCGGEAVKAILLDRKSGEPVARFFRNVTAPNGENSVIVKCLNMNGTLALVYSSAAASIAMNTVTPDTEGKSDPWSSASTIVSDARAYAFDCGVQADGTGVVAYSNTSDNITVHRFNTAGATVGSDHTSSDTVATTTSWAIGVGCNLSSSDLVYVAYSTATTVRYFIRSTNLASESAPPTTKYTFAASEELRNCCWSTSGPNLTYTIYNYAAGGPFNRIYRNTTIIAYGASLVSKVFASPAKVGPGNERFIVNYAENGGQEFYAMLSLDTNTTTAKPQSLFLLGEALYHDYTQSGSGSTAVKISLCNVANLGDDTYRTLVPRLIGHMWDNAPAKSDKYTMAEVTLDYRGVPNVVNAHGLPIMSGGLTALINNAGWDMRYSLANQPSNVVELGFAHSPKIKSLTEGASGSLTATGTYSFCAVYEWHDGNGRIYRSLPSEIEDITLTGANDDVTVVVTTLRATRKSDVDIVIYRTINGGATFYEDYRASNTLTANTVSIAIGQSDSALQDNTILYTDGGTLDNFGPGASKSLMAHRDRLVLTDEKNTVWYSKKFVPGVGIEFAGEQVIEPGEKTIPAGLEDRLIFLAKRGIKYTTGDGPNSLGQGYVYPALRDLATSVGCDNPLSIVNTDAGLIFQSEKGIYLLTRGFQLQPIGLDVYEYTKSSNVISARLVEDLDQVRFLLDDRETCLVLDLITTQWGVHKLSGAISATVWGGKYTFLQGDNSTYVENDKYTDGGEKVPLTVGTAWIKPAGPQGFYRVRRFSVLGDKKTHHKLKALVYYDYEDEPSEEVVFDAKTGTPAGSDVLQFRARLSKQKCQAVRFEFSDLDQSDDGEGYAISDLTLEVAPKSGINRLGGKRAL